MTTTNISLKLKIVLKKIVKLLLSAKKKVALLLK